MWLNKIFLNREYVQSHTTHTLDRYVKGYNSTSSDILLYVLFSKSIASLKA